MKSPRVLFPNTTATTQKQLKRMYPEISVHTSPHYYSYVGTQPNEPAALASYIDDLSQTTEREQIKAIVPNNDVSTLVSAVLNQRSGLLGPSEESILLTNNKYLMRQDLGETAISVTRDSIPEITEPMFLKAPYSAFGLFAQKISSTEELALYVQANWDDLVARNKNLFSIILKHFSIIDDYPEAIEHMFYLEPLRESLPQLTVEGLVQNGEVSVLAVVDSNMTSESGIFASFTTPSQVRSEVQNALEKRLTEVVLKLGLDNTVFNVEFWCRDDDTVDLIEINPRISTSFARLYQAAYGLDVRGLAVLVALGKQITLPTEAPRCAGLYNLRLPERERADQHFDFAAAKTMPEVAVRFKPERIITRNGHYGDVVADVLLSGESFAALEKQFSAYQKNLLL